MKEGNYDYTHQSRGQHGPAGPSSRWIASSRPPPAISINCFATARWRCSTRAAHRQFKEILEPLQVLRYSVIRRERGSSSELFNAPSTPSSMADHPRHPGAPSFPCCGTSSMCRPARVQPLGQPDQLHPHLQRGVRHPAQRQGDPPGADRTWWSAGAATPSTRWSTSTPAQWGASGAAGAQHLHRLRPGCHGGPHEGSRRRPRQAAGAQRPLHRPDWPPSIIAAEPPNPIVNELVILPDIEKRLEAFVRLGPRHHHLPGGVGTAEELLTCSAS